MSIHDPAYRTSPEAAEHARLMACLGAAPLTPALSLVKTDAGRRVVTQRMLGVAEQRIATAGEVSRDYLRTQFTEEEIAACWPGVENRLRPSIRDIAMAA